MNITITTYGCKEYLRRRLFITEGELEFIEVRPRRLMIADIQAAVSAHFQIDPSEMTSARRDREAARARQVAMYLSRKFTPRSLPDIGRRFGNRDHTTVIHAIRQIEKLRQSDPELDSEICILTRELEAA